MADATGKMREVLRGLPPFPEELPEFDVQAAPEDPVALFLTWFNEAVQDKILGPQTMTLATADGAGRVSSRVLICKDVDETGRWYFASSSDSEKGRDLAANPRAAASFYWPQHGRQIRIRGMAGSAGRRASADDFLARPPASRAAALIGQQSQPMSGLADLDDAFRACEAKIEADPGIVAPGWTLYALSAETVEFWQADHHRQHLRLQYLRTDDTWTKRLLWP
ncbi:MAG TPA: pyridoxal 5'-phosphate synthase [Streptosporangiaceae bacterium]